MTTAARRRGVVQGGAGSCHGVGGCARAAPLPLAAAHASRGVLGWAAAAAQGPPPLARNPLPGATPRLRAAPRRHAVASITRAPRSK